MTDLRSSQMERWTAMISPGDESAARGIAALFEEVARNIYPDRGPKNLHARQWAALRYFERAGAQRRTVTGLANYIGITMGPASRSVRSLVSNGLLRPEDDQPDRKAVVYQLSEHGREMLTHDPLNRFAAMLATLPPDSRQHLTQALEVLLDLQQPPDPR